MSELSEYLNLIMRERQWSWTLIAADYLVLALMIRFLLFRRTLKETKQIDRHLYSEVLKIYLRHSIAGWLALVFSIFLVVMFWIARKDLSIVTAESFLTILLISVLYLLSVILHYQAFTKALLTVLRQRTGVEREF